ncbi:MAG: hypothetical protein Q4B68_11235 [Bacteroidales bacterium]|nr:hypothetical protein [Bacteroidales bacterium]
MEQLLIDVSTPSFTTDIALAASLAEASGKVPENIGHDTAQGQDLTLWWVRYLMLNERESEAVEWIDNAVFSESIDEWPRLHHSWLWLVRMTIFIRHGDYILALGSAENALNVMVEVTNKRNEDFLAILASLLYNLAIVHSLTDDNSRAVKELTKAQKLLERLVKRDNARFSAMLLHAVEASTSIYKNRANQMNILAHYQHTTELYTAMLNEGGAEKTREALENLIESLKNEGDLLLQMGNARGAVKFYTKCLRYQKKLSSTMGHRELTLSIALARALIRLVNRRAAAEQLLNSLLPLAQRLEATKEMAEIEQLLNNRNKNFNIMTMLKGLS